MNNQAIITNERLNDFCKHQQAIEDKLNEVSTDLKELKDSFNEQTKEYKNICALIGEVPAGKSVMQCVRENASRTDRMWWAMIVVLGVIEFLANFPKIAGLFD